MLRRKLILLAALASLTGCSVVRKAKNGLARFFENDESSHKVDIVDQGHGSGSVIHEDGYILTNNHVAGDAGSKLRITIAEADGKSADHDAVLVAAEPKYDLAVIKIDRKFEHPVVIAAPEEVEVGELVYKIGFPYDFGKTVTRGSIAKRHYDYAGDADESWKKIMLLDIGIGHGDSGSGIYSQATGKQVAVTMGYFGQGARAGLFPRAVIPTEKIIAFLKEHGIPYHGAGAKKDKSWAVPISYQNAAPSYVIGISKK